MAKAVKKKARKKRVRFEPSEQDRKLVQTLIGYGLPTDEIRHLVINPETGRGVSKDTLYRHFEDEIESGHAVVNSRVLQTAASIATDRSHKGCVAMNIFWQKTRMGFKEIDVREHTGKDGKQLGPTLVIETGKRVD